MKLTVLGSGTAAADPERGPAGLLLEHAGATLLIDGGSGTLQRCARAGVDPVMLTAGLYSHRHPDHTGDLVPLLFAMVAARGRRTHSYPIWAGAGFEAFMAGLQGVYGKWIQPPGGVTVHELPLTGSAATALTDELTLVCAPANHSAGALHLRIDAPNATVVFSGDTGPSEALVELTRGADLLVCECAGSDHAPAEGHMTPTAVADLARRARPREIWLTHLYAGTDPQLAVQTVSASGVPTRHACDGEVREW